LQLLGAAQLSGFGVYLLASSTIGAFTSLVGVTLSFAFYTGMSSVISVVIGLVGLLLAVIPSYKTFKDVRSWEELQNAGANLYNGFKIIATGNYQLAEIIFLYIASARILNQEEFERRLVIKGSEVKVLEVRKLGLNRQVIEELRFLEGLNKEIEEQQIIADRLKQKLRGKISSAKLNEILQYLMEQAVGQFGEWSA
jgi:hypothetical protein